MGTGANPGPTMPAELLGLVLVYTGIQEGHAVRLVCRHWKHVFDNEPRLWSKFVIHPSKAAQKRGEPLPDSHRMEWMASKLHLLERVAQHVHEAELLSITAAGSRGTLQLRSVLSCLKPQSACQLTSLALGEPVRPSLPWDPSLDANLAALTQLRRLHFAGERNLVPTLLRLPLLEELCLSSAEDMMPDALAASVSRLAQLRCLCLSFPAVIYSAALASSLLQLSQLTRLSIGKLSLIPGSLYSLESLTRLSQLCRLEVECKGTANLQLPHTSALHSLARFEFSCITYAPQSSLKLPVARMRHCRFIAPAPGDASEGASPGPSGFSGSSGAAVLEIERLKGLDSLPQLLAHLVPTSVLRRCRSLDLALQNCQLDTGSLQPLLGASAGMQRLAAVRALRLDSVMSSGISLDAALEALLHLVPGLTSLEMQSCRLASGAAITQLLEAQQLQALVLRGCVPDLSGATFLSGLHTLDISHNRFERPPAVLAYATALTRLDLNLNQGLSYREFTAASMRLGMPRLKRLGLRGNRFNDLPPGSYLTGLTRLDFGANSLSTLPPQLAAATALRCLMLDWNQELSVSEAEAGHILLRLPHLRQLDLEGTQTAAEVLLHLRASAPHLDPAGLLTPQERPARRSDYASLMQVRGYEPRW